MKSGSEMHIHVCTLLHVDTNKIICSDKIIRNEKICAINSSEFPRA